MYYCQEILAIGIVVLIAIGTFKMVGPIVKYFDEEVFPEKKEERSD